MTDMGLAAKLDSLIREGNAERAQVLLTSRIEARRRKNQHFERREAAPLARVARRLSLPYLALEILRPIIHPRRPLCPPATAEERAVYAAALSRVGGRAEAMGILKALDDTKLPEVIFYKATVHILEWNYHKVIPLMKAYISHSKLTPYERLIGQVNLLAAYVFERNVAMASELLPPILAAARAGGYELLHGNALELAAQLEMINGDFVKARQTLLEARKILSRTPNLSELFVRKWLAILDLIEKDRRGSEGDGARQTLEQIRNEAGQRGNWETVRECDLYLALTLRDEELLAKVYLGTPYKRYRRGIAFLAQRFLGYRWRPPDSYVWRLQDRKPGEAVLNVCLAQLEGSGVKLKAGGVVHRVLGLFCRDFYRPVHAGELFSLLYSNEYFNPLSSPDRVWRSVHRLREWFGENAIPLKIEVMDGDYVLRSNGPIGLRVGKVGAVGDANRIRLQRLKKMFEHRSFSPKQAAEGLACSTGAASRLLRGALKEGRVYVSGRARGTRYHF